MGFARYMIQLHQLLAVAPDEHGSSGVPLRPASTESDRRPAAA